MVFFKPRRLWCIVTAETDPFCLLSTFASCSLCVRPCAWRGTPERRGNDLQGEWPGLWRAAQGGGQSTQLALAFREGLSEDFSEWREAVTSRAREQKSGGETMANTNPWKLVGTSVGIWDPGVSLCLHLRLDEQVRVGWVMKLQRWMGSWYQRISSAYCDSLEYLNIIYLFGCAGS